MISSMLSSFRKFSKSKAFPIYGVIFLIVFVGILHFSLMSMNSNMSDCPFMPGMSICSMTPFEHLNAWQQSFTSIPYEGSTAQIILVFSVIAFCFLYFYYLFSPPKVFSVRQKFYRQNKTSPVISFLQEAFSDGILNPKPF